MPKKILLDANILLGLLNNKDQFHNICLELFKEIDKNCKQNNIIQVVMPTHLYFEVNIRIRKKKKNNDWENFQSFKAQGPETYDIDMIFLNKIQDLKLYDKFDCLSANDAIYASISFIEKFPIITLDGDFDKVNNDINVIKLDEIDIEKLNDYLQ